MLLSIIIPAHNESPRICKTVSDINNWLADQNFDAEIIVVDDGSTDDTVTALIKHRGGAKNLRILTNPKNLGKGAAVKQGMLAGNGDFLLFMDADNAVSVREFSRFLPCLTDGYDVVIGSKTLPGAQTENTVAWHKILHRTLLSRLGNKLIRRLLKLEFADTQCGFKCFRRSAAHALFTRQTLPGWGFDIEILLLAKKLDIKIKEIPVHWRNTTRSKVKLFDYLRVLFDVVKLRVDKRFKF